MLDSLRQDVRYSARTLARTPLFAAIAIASVAIGIGATTAIVTLANTLLFRPPAGVGHPERVVSIGRTRDGAGFDNMTYPNFVDLRAATKTLSGMAAVRLEPSPMSMAGPAGGEAVRVSVVSGNFFDVLQARPLRGRFFTPDEDRVAGQHAVAVLSHAFWRDRFGSDPDVVGRSIVLNGAPFTVVGVAEPGFRGPFVFAPQLWVPVMSTTLTGFLRSTLENRYANWHVAIGRLAVGASLDEAQAELGGIAARLARDYPQANEGGGVRVMPASVLPGDMRTIVGGFVALLFAVAALVLVIACTNVTGMLLARAAGRQREIAVRLAIGASRAQLVRQLVVECVILFLAAGAAGVLVAQALVKGLMSLLPALPVALAIDPRLDWLVLTFAFGASLATGLAVGLVPALRSSAVNLVPALKADLGATRRQRLRSGLLVTQIAFSMLLLIVAGLFARTLARARAIDPGFQVSDVHMAAMDFGLARYDSLSGVDLAARIVAGARAIPGVRSAALGAVVPLTVGGMGLGGVVVAGRPAPDGRESWGPDWNVVTPGYLETMRIPLLQGRDFSDADRRGTADVAIVNETFARNLWPDQDPVGRTFTSGDRVVTVVGIARDGKYRTLGEPPRNFVYVPIAQWYVARMKLYVKAQPGAQPAAAMRRLIADLDRSLPILDLGTLEERTAVSLFPQKLALWAAGSLGVVALLLALLGIYGVVSFSVAQRTREIGVRVALGADQSRVVRMVLRQGVVLAGIGIAAGALAAAGVTRLITSLLYDVPPTDALSFGGAAALLGVAALAASWIPARRAAAVDPVVALRAD